MLWDLGVARRDMHDEVILRQRIAELDREFDQVLILERLDEGLVMLAENLCWTLKQVVTGKLNARSPERVQKLEGAGGGSLAISRLPSVYPLPGKT